MPITLKNNSSGGWVKFSNANDAGSNSFKWRIPDYPPSIELLVVAGGGAGGGASVNNNQGGGGGGGGLIYSASYTLPLVVGPYSISIGEGGQTYSANGQSSSFHSVVSIGGGGGGGDGGNGKNGGSGGGGGSSGTSTTGGSGTAGQGNNGGGSTSGNAAAGGGGAGGVGGSSSGGAGGNGGNGLAYSITGSSKYYSGGGGAYGGASNGSDGLGSGAGSIGGGGRGIFFGGAVNPGGRGAVILAYTASYIPINTISGNLTYTYSTTSRPTYRVYQFLSGSGTISW